jgi:eukaryotic translation initiation factor 2C
LVEYQIQLQYPELPLVDFRGLNVNYLPAELCEILPNQPFHGKLPDEQAAAMIRHARPPNAVAEAIETQGFEELGFSQNVPTLNAFGITISQQMATIPGRVISHPTIHYAKELESQSFNSGTADWNLKGVKFFKGATIRDWTVLLIRDGDRMEFGGPSDPKLRQILEGFTVTCRKHGLNIMSPPTITELHLPPFDKTDPKRGKAISMIRNVLPDMFKQKPQLVFTILSNSNTHIYSELKRVFDVTLDLRELSPG